MTGAMLAQFVSPALFAAGAAAVASPIIIHLLARRRFKRIRWAAVEFLLQAERRNRRRLRMEEWILLALRCLAVLCIGLFIARPFLAPGATLAGLAGSRRVERLLLLDDSFSMNYESASGEKSFDRAKRGIQRLVDVIRQEATDTDTVTLLRMTAPESPVETGVYLDDRQTAEFLERLGAVGVSQRSLDPARVMQAVADMLGRATDLSGAVLYVLSDFQRSQWARAESGGSGDEPGILEPLINWAGKERGLRFVFVNVADRDPANLTVSELRVGHGQLVAGAAGRLRVEVTNHSGRPAAGLSLDVSVDNVRQAPVTLREVPPRQSASMDLTLEFPRPGSLAVRVDAPGDSLPIDNVRYMTAEVVGAIRILIVNGEPSADRYTDEITFLTTALKPEGTLFSGNEPVVVDEAEFDGVNLAGFHVVILANVYRLSDPGVEALERFVRGGGGVLMFLGDQIDADLYNGELYRNGAGLLPAKLGEIVRVATESHIVIRDPLHPALRGISGENDPLGVGQIAFFQYFSCEPWRAGAEGAAAVAPGTATGDDRAVVLATYDDEAEHPAIVERAYGAGRVVLFTTTTDKEWNLWPDHPTYLPSLIEFAQHVARRADSEREWLVGERIEIPLDPTQYEPDAVVRTPGYPSMPEVAIQAEGTDDLRLVWEQTGAAGMYRFVLRRRDGGEVTRLLAVNVDPAEGDVTPATENDLRRAFPRTPFEYFNGIDQLSGISGEGRTELWRTCLIAAALFLMTEQTLAFVFGRRR